MPVAYAGLVLKPAGSFAASAGCDIPPECKSSVGTGCIRRRPSK